MTTYSVLLPFSPARPEQAVACAAFVHQRPACRLWQGHLFSIDPQQLYAYLAGLGLRVPTGNGVSLMPLRHPMDAALQARSLAAVTGQPVVAGFGPGAVVLQRNLRGAPYASPLQATREYATIVRRLMAGGQVSFAGEYFTLTGELPPMPPAPVELGLGVLRPGMARLAGELADAAITWLAPPAYLRERLQPAFRAGADAAGRPPPRVVAMVPVALAEPDRNPLELALHSNAIHLQQPHYLAMLRQAGVAVDPGDVTASARGLLDSGIFCYGSPAEVVAQLDQFTLAGVDEVVVSVIGVCSKYGARVALQDLTALFEELPRHERIHPDSPAPLSRDGYSTGTSGVIPVAAPPSTTNSAPVE